MTPTQFPLPASHFLARLTLALLAALTLLLLQRPATADAYPLWELTSLDPTRQTNGVTSMALDSDGHPHVAYAGYRTLKVAEWDGSAWRYTTVATPCVYESSDISLALRPDGTLAAVSYYDICADKVRVGRGLRASGGADWVWTILDVPTYSNSEYTSVTEYHSSAVAIDPTGGIHLVFAEDANVYYTVHRTSWFPLSELDDAAHNAFWDDVSVTLDSASKAHISFINGSGRLTYAYPAPTFGWNLEDVAILSGADGADAALALAGGNMARIAFHDTATRSLKYAERSAVNTWEVTSIDAPAADDTAGDAGPYTALALDSSGNPHIAYQYAYNGDEPEAAVKHAFWDGAAWQTEWVDTGYWGWGEAIEVGDDGVHVSYVMLVGSNQQARYAKRTEDSTPSAAPDTLIDTSPPRLTNDTAVFTFHSDNPAATFECRNNSQSWMSCTSPHSSYASDGDGTYTFFVRATAGGLTDLSPAFYTWTRDTTAPDSYIITGPDRPSNSPDATFTFKATDASPTTFRCRVVPEVYVPGDVWPDFQDCTSPKSFTGIDDGDWVFELTATDAAGNAETYHDAAFYWWTIDLPGPATTLTATPPKLTNSTSATFEFTSDDPTATFVCSLNGAVFTVCTSPATYTVTQGSHTFSVRATAGPQNDPIPASYTWVVDTTPPTASIGDKPPLSDQLTTATFTFTSNDPTATFQCQLNSSGYTACATPKTYTGLMTGNYTFNVRAIDPAGNITPNPASYSWYTAGPPQTSLYYPDPLPVYTTSTSISFLAASNKTGSSYQCRLDGGTFAGCADGNGQSYTNLAPGVHTFAVRATDSFGQPDPTPATHTWTIDPYWPDTRLDGAPANPSNSSGARFLFSSGSAGATFECQTDAGNWSTCANPKEYSGLSNGAHTFAVRATSGAGIVDPTPATYTWTITAGPDTTSPDTTITLQPANPANSARATFAFTSNDASATFECALDSASFAACGSPITYSGLYSRDYVFKVRARDDKGNVDSSPAQVSWSIQFGNDPDVLALGQYHACALQADGSVDCWGSNSNGQATDQDGPFTAIAANDSATCGLRPDGAVDCWGMTNHGGADQTGPFTQISGGAYSFCGVKTDNSVACWGWNANGQATNQTGPYTLVSAGTPHTCALNSAGAITCWGSNSGGQLSAPSGAFYRLVSGYSHSCAMKTDGSVDCWGYNAYGQNADQTGPYTQLTTGHDHNCALKSDGSADCWGRNDYGQAADQPGPYVAIAAGGHFTCALSAGGSVDCWGINPDGRAEDQPGPFGPVVLDTFAPDTRIDSGPATTTEASDAAFTFRGNESGVSFECALDGAAYVACTSPQNYTGLALGAHTFRVRSTDEAGNVDASPAEHAWTIAANEPPDTTITTAPAALSNSASASFAFSSSETGSTFQCALDGAAFATCTSPKSYSGLSDGAHTFAVKASDGSGTADPTPASHTWTIDTTPPDTTITQSPSNPSTSSGATFAFSSETGATFECKLDSEAWAACTSPKTYASLSDAGHTFNVRAKDAAGNSDASPAVYTWTIDATPPDTTITGQPNTTTSSTSATFTFTGVDAASFECQLDSQSYAACTSPQQYDGLSAGSHTFNVRAKDAEGRYDPSPSSYCWTIDAAAPETTITTKPADPSNDATPDFAFTSNEGGYADGIFFYCQTDSNGWFPCGGDSITYYNLFEGPHTFYVKAEDALGNIDPTPASWSWTMDLTAPETTITVKPAAVSNSATAAFQFTSEGGATFECKLDSGSFAACTSPKSYTALATGSHTFSVRARDAATNVDASPASYTWTIDTTAPDTTITQSPPNPSPSSGATFAFSSEAGATFECQLDAGAFAACTSAKSYTGLTDGSHTFSVRAKDAAGNTDASPATFTWVIDTTPPDTTLLTTPPNPAPGSSAQFTFSSDAGATFACRLDSAAYAPCTSPQNYTGLATGSHTFNVQATDAAGNTDPTPASYTWTVPVPTTLTVVKQTDPHGGTNFPFMLTPGAVTYVNKVGGPTTGSDSGKFDRPDGIAVDAAGNIYVADTYNFRIQKFDATGAFLAAWGWDVIAANGVTTYEICVAGQTCKAGVLGGGKGQFSSPRGVALDAAGNIYVADYGNNRIQQFSPTGAFIATWGWDVVSGGITTFEICTAAQNCKGGTTGGGTGQFNLPFGLILDAAGNVYVADTNNHRIQKFNAAHAFVAAWGWDVLSTGTVTTYEVCTATQTCKAGVSGGGNGQFKSPYAVALDGAGNVYVADAGNHRIEKFTDAGVFIAAWGQDVISGNAGTGYEVCTAAQTCKAGVAGSGSGSLNYPTGVAADEAGNAYVVDLTNHRIERFDADGTFNTAWGWDVVTGGGVGFEVCTAEQSCKAGVSGTGDGQLYRPSALALSGADVYVVEPNNYRVQKFRQNLVVLDDGESATYGDLVAGNYVLRELVPAGWVVTDITCNGGSPAESGNNVSLTLATGDQVTCTFTNAPPDTTPPQTTLDSTPAGLSNDNDPSFTFSGDDGSGWGVASFECKLDAAAYAACTSPQRYTDLSDGSHTFEVRAVDKAGNYDATPASYSWTIDATAPDTTLTGQPPALTTNTTADFTFSSEEGATFECKLDGNSFTTCTSPQSYTGLSDGSHTFSVRARDAAGNVDSSPAGHTWMIDTAPPTVNITGAPPDPSDSDAATFTFSSEAGATFECSLDGADFAACTSPQSFSGLSDGSHTFNVRATDAAGNTGSPAGHTWTIDTTPSDTTPPETTLDSAPASPANDNDPSFTFSSNEAGSTFECQLDGGGFNPCTSPQSYTDLSDGSHTFSVRATDAAGNTDASPAGHTWTIAMPTATLTIAKETIPGGGTGFPFVLLAAKWGSPGSGDGQISYPADVAVDRAGNVYVADTGNDRIQKFDHDGIYLAQWGSPGSGDGQFQVPASVAVDMAGNVYVVDQLNHRIQKFDSSGNYLAQWGSQGSGDGQFYVPNGIAVDGAGFVYVVDYRNSRIQKFDGDGNYLNQWGSEGSGDGQFQSPLTVAVDGAGHVYVTDSDNFRIQKFDDDGNYLDQWGEQGSGHGQFAWPAGVATDAAGNVYVTDSDSSRIQKFDGDGNFLNQWGTIGSGDGQFKSPFGLAVAGSGIIYVADAENHRIQAFNREPVAVLDDGESQIFTGIPAGTIFVGEPAPDGWTLADVTCNGGSPIESDTGVGLTLAANDNVTCTFTNNGPPQLTITKQTDPPGGTDFAFTLDFPTAHFLASWGENGSGNGQFNSPFGIAVDGPGNVYVVDTYNHRIQKFDGDGNYLGQWGSPGNGDGQLYYPRGATVDGAGNVYVADSGNDRIQKFDADGTFLAQWGGYGNGNGQFSYAFDVAVDATGNVYVADQGNNRIQKFDSEGNYLTQWGSPGGGNSQFDGPNGVAVDGAGNVYVADAFNNRIQKFTGDGAYLSQWGGHGSGDGQFSYPIRVAVDTTGNVYVYDTDNSRVQKFDGDGNYLDQWGSYGSGNGQFSYNSDVAVDTAGNIYVSEAGNNRIQKFTYRLSFTLDDGGSQTVAQLVPGVHLVTELLPADWTLDDITCDGGSPAENGNSVAVTLALGDVVTCTFSNSYAPPDTPPQTTLDSAPADPTNDNDPSFTFSSNEAGSTFECQLDSGGFDPCTSPQAYTDLSDGSHTFSVRATDAAGNTDASPASHIWTIDTAITAPTLDGCPKSPTTYSEATLSFSLGEAATFKCQLNGSDWAACTSPQSYMNLDDGDYAFGVSATDAAGNVSAAATCAWTVDTTPPETTIDTWIGPIYTVDTITIEFHSDEANSTFECQLDSGGWEDCTSPTPYNDLIDGPHTFDVRATDPAGNTDPSPAAAAWSVQTPGPDTSLDSAPPNPSTSATATFTFSSTDAVSFECALDGADFTSCTSPHELTGLADGPHLFLVRAVNAQGRVDESPADCFWLVDATPPSVTINQADTQTDPTSADTIHFTVNFSEPVNDFMDGDVTLSGAAGAKTATVTNLRDHMVYDVAIGGMTTSGTVIATVAANVASDAAGHANTASTSTDNSVTYAPLAPPLVLYVTASGGTVPGVGRYQKNDILKWDGTAWSVWFDGAGKTNPTADIIAFDVADATSGDATSGDAATGGVYLAFRQAQRNLTGLSVSLAPQDIAYYDGARYSFFLDGSDVGLSLANERINGIEVLPGNVSPIGADCLHYLLLSTNAGGSVRNGTQPAIRFTGEDVLGFCMTGRGPNTTGLWHLVLEGQGEGLPKNGTVGLSASADATTLYFTVRTAFEAENGLVQPSQLVAFTNHTISAPLWRAADYGLLEQVDGIDVGN